jgi:mono/diheme cytochrome c family protein
MFKIILILLPVLVPLRVAAEEPETGQRLFSLHCAACHGLEARGTGPVGNALSARPEDLTRLARRNGGTFPTARTVARIDGRTPFEAHGGEMPVYGWFFAGPAATLDDPEVGRVETTEAIASIVLWLQTLQR